MVVGVGIVGTVYAAQLIERQHDVSVLDRGDRANQIASSGLIIRDDRDGTRQVHRPAVVPDALGEAYDLVIIAVRGDQLASAFETIAAALGSPTFLVFGNNPSGRDAFPPNLQSAVRLGFPGIGGWFDADTVSYVRIAEQPTALEARAGPVLDEFARSLTSRGFRVQRVEDMDGWLLFHAVFVACVFGALRRCGGDPSRLGHDREALVLMCQSITEGFADLRSLGIDGVPRNLSLLHRRPLRLIAVSCWGRTMRSPNGERYFAAHVRNAPLEMSAIASAVVARVGNVSRTKHLRRLLSIEDISER